MAYSWTIVTLAIGKQTSILLRILAKLYCHLPLLEKRMLNEFNERDKDIQLEHRGLYAEYNLVYDRGTKFGLATGHDANAVLMSLPPLAKWY